MEFRKLKKDEINRSIEMSEFAFQYELSDEEREDRLKWIVPEETWVASEKGELLSKVTVMPFHVYIDGQAYAMGGVSGVATWPEKRRSGLVRTLLGMSLEEMKRNGQTVSFLHPFSVPFYRKFGWEMFAWKRTVDIPREKLPARKSVSGSVERVKKDPAILGPVYDQWASRYNATIRRTDEWWERSIFKRKKGHAAVYRNGEGTIRGYIIYTVKEETMTVKELVHLDADARNGLWNFISNHDSMIENAELTLPGDDSTMLMLDDPDAEQTVIPYFMARIVDVKPFLEQYTAEKALTEPVILHIDDAFCNWNTGTYILKPDSEENGVLVEHYAGASEGSSCAHPPKRGLSMDIQTLSAAVLNAHPAQLLYTEERILGTREELERFKSLVSDRPAYFYDFF
ncbi:GNAT family N-acetyltransferase [Alteribacter natronophilus]|uniref:GNAT family N-acetyltransferase n=1 Tax=Alteribacter natronophilus TaxID=2583810 RepID=UPI00110D4ACF|nr:GNAT family N-acetyltransferase [Alteribacter natronophilus]TMW70629.1 GNAT family N-acetyltransferase [Alteribacter natronophilus]